jgi:CRP-like cAMP-binding protein
MKLPDRPAPPTLIVLRFGDPVVDALRAAGSGPLVILRVLPPALRSLAPSSPTAPPPESAEGAARAHLSELVVGRRPAPRLVVRWGEMVEEASSVVAEVRPCRVVCARDLARPLARVVAVPVLAAEDAVAARRDVPPKGTLGLLRRALDRHEDAKVSAVRALAMLDGVEAPDLRSLAAHLDWAEVGPGTVLVAEGRRNDTLWLLVAGSARRSVGGREAGRLCAPALVGGPSIIYDRAAIATVTALEPVRSLVAGRAQFQAISAIDSVTLRLRAATADRLSDYLSARDLRRPAGAPNGWRALV